MTSDLREQLAGAVGSAYRIDDELGGGGMSRVFVAEDIALGRRVVIKVLHPELAAGVNVERFKREVLLAARLQHPHIVPVLAAGEVDGLPYYIMPFVKGESLQARLARGPLPIAEVINLIADVAKALAYAHSEGVVHRDIKPDNILVTSGAATVADFGIAKAISSSRRDENESLTTVGTSIGTAAYMAPEQVAGDPSLDHRADIYALGCVAYELLTGASPFAGKSPQQMLAAHVLETPAPIRVKRPDTPPALARLVERCMAKDPAQRPPDGEAVLAALDEMSLGRGGGDAPRSHGRYWFAATALLVVFVVGWNAVARSRRHARARTGVTLAVAPFEVLDPQLQLWKEGLVDVLSRNLDGAAGMHTVSPSFAIKRWEGRVGRAEALTFARRTSAQVVLYGSLQPSGRDLVDATVWILDTRSSASPLEISARDSSTRMDRLSDSLSVKLLTALGGSRAAGVTRSLGSGSLPAIKAFLQGAQYFRHTRFDSAAVAFRQAIAFDTSFAIAYAYLNQSLGWIGGTEEERTGDALAARHFLRPGMSPLDSLMIAAIGHYYDTTSAYVANHRAAYAAAQRATVQYPNDALAWYTYADFRLHSDPTISDQEAFTFFNRSIEADSDFAPSYIHAIELAYRFGADVGIKYTQAYLARNPGEEREEQGLRLAMELASPNAAQNPELAAAIDTASPVVVRAAASALMRLGDSVETTMYLLRTAAKRPDAPRVEGFQQLLASESAAHGFIADAWKRSTGRKEYTASEIVALGLVPAESAAVIKSWVRDRSEASYGALVAFAVTHDSTALGKALPEIEKFAATPRPSAPLRARLSVDYFVAAARAYYQLARGDTAAAAKAFDALSDSLFQLPIDQFYRARLLERTDPRRALQLLRAGVTRGDLISVARELEIGRLSEKLNDVPRAVDAYNFVANSWVNSDSDQLKNAVRESRDALKRLDADGRVRAQLLNQR